MALRSVLAKCKASSSASLSMFESCHQAAAQLQRDGKPNGGGVPMTVYGDLCPSGDSATARSGSGAPLTGVVVAVSDCLNVAGIRTTNGVNVSMLHHVPPVDDTLIDLLRSRGVRFVGKIASQAPLAFGEAPQFDRSPVAAALKAGSCHAAIVSSLRGPPGIAAASLHGMAAYIPTAGSLVVNTPAQMHNGGAKLRKRSHLTGLNYKHAFVAPSLDDLHILWSAMVHPSECEEDKSGRTGRVQEGEEEDDASEQQGERGILEPTSSSSCVEEGESVEIGVPLACLGGLDRQRGEGGFLNCLRSHIARQRELLASAPPPMVAGGSSVSNLLVHRNPTVSFDEIAITQDQLDTSIRCAVTIANYELAQAMTASLEVNSGLMDSLPESLTPSIYSGKNTSAEQYNEAKEQIAEIHSQIDAELQEVDMVALPLLSEPFKSGHLRSLSFGLPFFLSGYPMVSLPCSGHQIGGQGDCGPVLLVGEMGDDRGLFSQASIFSAVVDN